MEVMKLLTPKQIKEIDSKSINDYKIPELLLMEDAAYGVFSVIKRRFKNYRVVVICGPGNNGGDGMALARILNSAGWDVNLTFTGECRYKEASLTNFNLCSEINSIPKEEIPFTEKTLVVDAIFGIGLNREVAKDITELFNRINSSKSKILSIDIPSGINGLNGKIMGSTAIKADITVTICAPKLGMYMFPGHNYCGEIIVCEISAPPEIINTLKAPEFNKPVAITKSAKSCHKTTYGKTVTVAGCKNYYGAPYFASKAALLSGSGYSTLISQKEIIGVCAVLAPEVIYKEESDLKTSVDSKTTVIIGPGIGLDSRAENLIKEVSDLNPKNLIIDGDALTIISKKPELIKRFSNCLILTPHPAEAARLLNKTTTDIEDSRLESVKEISKKYNSITVLKGSHTLISAEDETTYLNSVSSSALATAGSGDILCGVIAGLLGRCNPVDAVRAGVYIHGLSGTILEKKVGLFGNTTNNILQAIPEAINSYLDF